MRQRVGMVVAVLAASLGAGLFVGAAVRTAGQPGADVPVVCVMAAAADDGVPVPAPHAWERRCER